MWLRRSCASWRDRTLQRVLGSDPRPAARDIGEYVSHGDEVMAELATLPPAKTLEKLLLESDLSGLTPQERIDYLLRARESVGLKPTTKPFAYIKLNGKLVLYALRDCTEQLRKLHGVSVTGMTMQTISDVYVVSAEFRDKSGRTDQATGCVP